VGPSTAKLTVAGVARTVALYLPQKRAAKPALVIVCHGTDGDAGEQLAEAAGDKLADSEGLVVAAPQARVMPKADWDQHTAGQIFFETYPKVTLETNVDLQLIVAIIAEAKAAYGIDEKRVYIAGFSNGAFFAQFAAMALGGRIAAFASKSGGLVRCDTTDVCTFSGSGSSCAALATQTDWCSCSGSEKPGPIATTGYKPAAYLVHAADDGTVSPYYTCQLADRLKSLGYDVQLNIVPTGGHEWGDDFLPTAWPFLSKHVVP
jgi:poly(3-hydroxybutyrate) depolymerase